MNVVTSLVYFPMLFLSGAIVPYELFPKGLRLAADVMPLTQGIKLLKSASMGMDMQGMWYSVAILGVITIVCGAISIRTFRWE